MPLEGVGPRLYKELDRISTNSLCAIFRRETQDTSQLKEVVSLGDIGGPEDETRVRRRQERRRG